LELRGITKSYGPVLANSEVSLTLTRGSVHAVLGENGAGKSTLMKVLFGMEKPDAGEITIDGVVRAFRSPSDAISAGVGMVLQHFGLVGELTALDNISLGAEVGRFGINRTIARARIEQLASDVGLHVPLDRRVQDITISERQRVEILKALYRGARILILDEPTALLAPQERVTLFDAVKRLQMNGLSVLFITHKLDEVDYLANDITVMRQGQVVATHRAGEVGRSTLIAEMVGGNAIPALPRPTRVPGETVLSVHDLVGGPSSGHPLRKVSLDVRRGEILGVAGIDGHGHQTLCQIVAGTRPAVAGQLRLSGKARSRWNRRNAMAAGVAYVPEDRLGSGVAAGQSIAENLVANRLGAPEFVRWGILRSGRVLQHATELIRQFDIRSRDAKQSAGSLSGGNVQKVVLARELSIAPEVIVVCEPTRGLDVGAIASVHRRLNDAAASNAAVIVQSSDLDEILAIADRIVVFREGEIVGDVANDEQLNVSALGEIMLGTESRQSVA
jgi:simple sugar transport system ATP-binding protein